VATFKDKDRHSMVTFSLSFNANNVIIAKQCTNSQVGVCLKKNHFVIK